MKLLHDEDMKKLFDTIDELEKRIEILEKESLLHDHRFYLVKDHIKKIGNIEGLK
jgi:hypothetical protein